MNSQSLGIVYLYKEHSISNNHHKAWSKNNDKQRSWDQTWLAIAQEISKRSKDPTTKVGCVLASSDNRLNTLGWNGFPSGVLETPERWSRPNKYDFCIHAEENAIINARQNLAGWTCYTTLFPCRPCAMKLIQAGITRIVYLSTDSESLGDWKGTIKILSQNNIVVDSSSSGPSRESDRD